MTIEQIVDIPADRRLHLDFEVPLEIPTGKARLTVTPLASPSKLAEPKIDITLLSLRGSCKGFDTMDAYFERKRADKALEDRKDGCEPSAKPQSGEGSPPVSGSA